MDLLKCKNITQIRLWHARLEHLSFQPLNVLFRNLFKSVSPQSLQYEVCQLATVVGQRILQVLNESLHYFDFIHADFWAPSRMFL